MIAHRKALAGVVLLTIALLSGCEAADLAQVLGFRSAPSIEQMIRSRWRGTGQENTAVRIAKCESGLQTNPRHNNPHYGVFQMGSSEFRSFGHGSIFNAADNIDAAFRYWDAGRKDAPGRKLGSWGPWACR